MCIVTTNLSRDLKATKLDNFAMIGRLFHYSILKHSLFFGLIALVVFGCAKEPKSDFQLKQYEYAAGDEILYENFSENYKTNKWEILTADGTVKQVVEEVHPNEEIHPNIVLDILTENGVYILKLTNYNGKDGKKSSSTEKSFLVKSIKNYLTVNPTENGDQTHFDVYVDNQFIGSSIYYSFMDCGQFQKKIPAGLRLVKLVSDTETLEGVYDFNSSVNINF